MLTMMVDNIEEAELCKIAEKFVQEIDHSQVMIMMVVQMMVMVMMGNNIKEAELTVKFVQEIHHKQVKVMIWGDNFPNETVLMMMKMTVAVNMLV